MNLGKPTKICAVQHTSLPNGTIPEFISLPCVSGKPCTARGCSAQAHATYQDERFALCLPCSLALQG